MNIIQKLKTTIRFMFIEDSDEGEEWERGYNTAIVEVIRILNEYEN